MIQWNGTKASRVSLENFTDGAFFIHNRKAYLRVAKTFKPVRRHQWVVKVGNKFEVVDLA